MTSAFWEAIVASLRCPKCPAENRPGVSLIKLDDTRTRACCDQCAHDAPLEKFQPDPRSPA